MSSNCLIKSYNSDSNRNYRVVISTDNFFKLDRNNDTDVLEAEKKIKKSTFSQDYDRSSILRTKRNLTELIRHNICSNDRFLTLTYRNSCFDRRKVFKDIENCRVRFKKNFNQEFKYLCVLEYHTKGHGLHAHLILKSKFFDINLFSKKVWRQGFSFVKKVSFKNDSHSSFNIANYLSKYIEKDFSKYERNQKRFTKSQDFSASLQKKYCSCENVISSVHSLEDYLNSTKSHFKNFTFKASDSAIFFIFDVFRSDISSEFLSNIIL